MNILERWLFKAKTGASIQDLGRIKEEVVIRYKDLYLNLLIDENDDIASLSWSDSPTMFNVPVRDFWTAAPPNPKKEILHK